MHYCRLRNYDVANGPGVRVTLFVSGCRNHCKGCFQPETWDPNYGDVYNRRIEMTILKWLESPNITGFTLLGGDPFEPENLETCTKLCKRIKEEFPNKTIWCYTGYFYEDLEDKEIMNYIDVLVDSPFDLEKKDYSHKFRGSTNQRILKLRGGKVYEFE